MRQLRIILLVVLAAHAPDSWIMPDQEQGRIRVQTTLVNVPVVVSDISGGAVLGLQADDFILLDDGIRQKLAFFVAAAEPIRVALVLDTSKSTTTVLRRIREAAAGFISQLRPQDRAMVASFDAEIRILCPMTSDGNALREAIRNAAIGEYTGSRMRDAVAAVVENHLQPGPGRKAVILLTDGQDFGSTVSAEELLLAVVDAGVVVYPVHYAVNRRELVQELFDISLSREGPGKAAWEKDEEAAAAMLQTFADDSTGAFFRSEVTDLKKTFARVAEELRHQYLLAFYPHPSRIDGEPHTLRVSTPRPNMVIRARRYYRASLMAGSSQ